MTYLDNLAALSDEELIAHARDLFDRAQFKNGDIALIEARNVLPEVLSRLEALVKDRAEWVEPPRLD